MSTFEEELALAESKLEMNYLIVKYNVVSRYNDTIPEDENELTHFTTENLRYSIMENNLDYFKTYFVYINEDNVQTLFEEICQYKRREFLRYIFLKYHHPFFSDKIFSISGSEQFVLAFIEELVNNENYYTKQQLTQLAEIIYPHQTYGYHLMNYCSFSQDPKLLDILLESNKIKNTHIILIDRVETLFSEKKWEFIKTIIDLNKIPEDKLIQFTTMNNSETIVKHLIYSKLIKNVDDWIVHCIKHRAIDLLKILEENFEICYTETHLKLSLKESNPVTRYFFEKGYIINKDYIPLLIQYKYNDIILSMTKDADCMFESTVLVHCVHYKNYTIFKHLINNNLVKNPYTISVFMRLDIAFERDIRILIDIEDTFWVHFLSFCDQDLFKISSISESYLKDLRINMNNDLDHFIIKDVRNIISEYI